VELGDRAAILPGVFVIEQGAIHGTGSATIQALAVAGTVKIIVTGQL
jgi:hypothetical protein